MVPVDSNDIVADYKILLNELGKFNPELIIKDRILAITKCDLVDEELRKMVEKDMKKNLKEAGENVETIFISAAANYNIDRLKDAIMNKLG
jgi:GTP-binding protein